MLLKVLTLVLVIISFLSGILFIHFKEEIAQKEFTQKVEVLKRLAQNTSVRDTSTMHRLYN